MLFDLLELRVLALKLLAFGSEGDHLLFLFLEVILLLLKLLLVVTLILCDLSHLSLLLLHEFLMVLQFLLQVLDFFLLLLELCLHRIVLSFRDAHRLLHKLQILNQLIILGVHLLDPVLQIRLLIIDNLLILQQFVSLRLQLLDLVLHLRQFVLQGLVLVGVARLELLDNVLVALDRARHFLLEVVELPLKLLRLSLL